MNLLLLVDEETVDAHDPLLEAEEMTPGSEMEQRVARGLRDTGHHVDVLPFVQDVATNVAELQRRSFDLVVNLTEWFKGDRRKDAAIAGLLDLLGLRYTGAGPVGLMWCRDKALCKRLLAHHRMRQPPFMVVPPGKKRISMRVPFPVIVKPLYEDGSDGISLASIVHDESALLERVRVIHEQQRQPAICEAYISGREIYVGLIGNERLRVFPPREVLFGRSDEGGPPIATAKVKWDEAYREKWGIAYVHAELDLAMTRRVVRIARNVFRAMQLRDYGRIDLRVTPDNEIYLLEANPNPNLAPDDELAEAANQAGVAYPELLDQVVRHAWRRYT